MGLLLSFCQAEGIPTVLGLGRQWSIGVETVQRPMDIVLDSGSLHH